MRAAGNQTRVAAGEVRTSTRVVTSNVRQLAGHGALRKQAPPSGARGLRMRCQRNAENHGDSYARPFDL